MPDFPILGAVRTSTGAVSGTTRGPRVLLISMPWAPLIEPSLGLAILNAQLEEAGIPCTVSHLNIFLLKYLKPETYERVGQLYAFNDFTFTRVVESADPAQEQLDTLARMIPRDSTSGDLRRFVESIDTRDFINYALRLRNEAVPAFLNDCLKRVDESDATMVGFTCMYDQTLASVALAKLVKEKFPEKLVVFGGYALEKPVGPQILRCFPWIDVVAFGEGEDVITPLAQASLEPDMLAEIPGIAFRDRAGALHETGPKSTQVDLEKSPIPNYDDFLRDITRLRSENQVEVTWEVIPVESSRGCWWGQVQHCVFCGIDEQAMRFRHKSPERVKQILATLSRHYELNSFRFSDYILPRQYYKTLLPDLAKLPEKFQLHWEMKSNVKLEEVQIMGEAGVKQVQPGIESFSTPVLRKMAKGVTGIQNVLTIKLLMEHDILVHYNILFGFPTDEPEEYRQMCERIPLLFHLFPPFAHIPVLTTRFAPLQTTPERFAIRTPLSHNFMYEVIFSKEYRERIGFVLSDYCYVFETPYEPSPECKTLYSVLVYQLHHWITSFESRTIELSFRNTQDGIEFTDSRYDEGGKRVAFGPNHALVYAQVCHAHLTRAQLGTALCGQLDSARIAEVLSDFVAERLVYQEGDKFLGLAFPAACYERWAKLSAAETQDDSTEARMFQEAHC